MLIGRIFDIIEDICMWGSVVGLMLMMFLSTFDVLARKIFDYSIPSLYEFTEDYLMVALVFLSLSYVYKMGGHVRVTLFIKYIPGVIKKSLNVVLDLAALVLFFMIMVKGWENTFRAFQLNEVCSSLLAYPMGPALLLVPVGSALLCVRIAHSIILSVTGKSGQQEVLSKELQMH